MEHLKELIDVFRKQQWPYAISEKEGKMARLLEMAGSATPPTEKQAATALYGSAEQDSGYRMLKFRLQEELLQELLLQSCSWHHSHKNIDDVYQLRKRLMTGRFLLLNGSVQGAFRIIRSVSIRAAHFQEYLVQYDALSLLLICYRDKGNTQKLQECRAKMLAAEKKMRKENKAEAYFSIVSSYLKRKNYLTEAELEECRGYIAELEQVTEKKDTLRFRYYLARLQALLMEYEREDGQNTEQFIQTWKSIENRLRKNMHLVTPEILSDISVNLTKAYVYKGQYDEALKMLRFAALYFIDHHPVHWFQVKRIEFTVLAWSERIDEAERIVYYMLNHARFHTLEESHKAIWNCIAVQLDMMGYKTCKEKGPDVFWRSPEQMETIRKDKKGWNISLYLIEIVWLCRQDNFEEALHRLDAFRKYMSKHIDTTYHYRVKCFYQLLLLYARHGGIIPGGRQAMWEERLRNEKPNFSTIHFEALPYTLLFRNLD